MWSLHIREYNARVMIIILFTITETCRVLKNKKRIEVYSTMLYIDAKFLEIQILNNAMYFSRIYRCLELPWWCSG